MVTVCRTPSVSPDTGGVTGQRLYHPELDSLRFFAFFAVFLLHAFYQPITGTAVFHLSGWAFVRHSVVGSGAFGVDLFFVLSAYLITELLLREKGERGVVSVPAFYARRVLRIWPLYFFFLALAYFVPILNPGHLLFRWKRLVWFSLLGGNWSVVAYGWPDSIIVTPLWSVSVEEQFYLLWAPLVKILTPKRIELFAVGLLFVATLARAATLFLHSAQPKIWCNTFTRLDPIAVGILVAVSLKGRVPSLLTSTRCALTAVGTGLIVMVALFTDFRPDNIPSWPGTMLGYPAVALGCALILLSVLGSSSRIIQARPLRYLGKISYGLYVYHALAIFLVSRILALKPEMSLWLFPVSLGLTIMMAAVSYRFLEAPFLKLKRRFTYVESRPV